MKIKQIDIWRLKIPLRMPIRHNLADHRSSDNLVVQVTTDTGITGAGEGVPRNFVTGETFDDSIRHLEEMLIPRLAECEAANPQQLKTGLTDLLAASLATGPAACCALELAILDAAGKSWNVTLADFFESSRQALVYSAVIPILEPKSFEGLLHLVRDMRMPFAKIKVGFEQDVACVARAREILGDNVDLRVDANGAWQADEAVARILEMLPYGISAVEQPVAKEDIAGFYTVAAKIPVPLVADESLCTLSDAQRLVGLGARLIFNLRLSKCGGALAVDRLQRFGQRYGISSQLGCQVGETGILAAAGRQMASTRAFRYLEGSYSRFILTQDIVREAVDIGPEGVARLLPGYGAGITINVEALQHLSVLRRSYSL